MGEADGKGEMGKDVLNSELIGSALPGINSQLSTQHFFRTVIVSSAKCGGGE